MRIPLIALAFAAAALLAGCEDVRRFSGEWVGTVSADPALRQPYDQGATARATVTHAARDRLDMTVTLPDHADPLRFQPIQRASADVLGELRLEGEPLRTYLGYLQPIGASPYLAVVSLFPEDRIALRVIRGPSEVYAIFSLARSPGRANERGPSAP